MNAHVEPPALTAEPPLFLRRHSDPEYVVLSESGAVVTRLWVENDAQARMAWKTIYAQAGALFRKMGEEQS